VARERRRRRPGCLPAAAVIDGEVEAGQLRVEGVPGRSRRLPLVLHSSSRGGLPHGLPGSRARRWRLPADLGGVQTGVRQRGRRQGGWGR
jgi:hypothetical protein